MVGESALLAVALLAGGNRVLLDNLSATDSGTRFRAAYALAHVYDTSNTSESEIVRKLILTGLPGEQGAAGDGVHHRRWPGNRVPDDIADALFPAALRRTPEGRPLTLPSWRVLPPVHDALRLLSPDRARRVMAQQPGFESRDFQLWLERGDPAAQRQEEVSTGNWDRRRLGLASRPASRPPCFNECLGELMWFSWMGMDMAPILEIRRPATTEVDFWTDTMFRLVRASGGDTVALDSLVADLARMPDAQTRGALLVWLVNLPPGLEIHATVRPALVSAAYDRDPGIRRYAIEVLAVRPEMYGYAGGAAAFAAVLGDTDPDVRARAACELWDLAPLSGDIAEKVRAAAATEPDAVVGAVLRSALER